MKEPPKKYKIADVSISEDGKIFWIGYYGYHADQGGNTFRWGEVGYGSVQEAIDGLKYGLELGRETIHEELKRNILLPITIA